MFMDKKGPGDMGRSIGGFKTNDPLSYQLRMDYDGRFGWCGASLISSKYAITAYHCIVGYPLFYKLLRIKNMVISLHRYYIS